jgi:hypothetical protein
MNNFFQIIVQESHFNVHLLQFIVIKDSNDEYDLIDHEFDDDHKISL